MNIHGFRGVADRPNAVVLVDLKSAHVKVRNNHALNRAITWLQRKFAPNPLRDTATDAARNKFLQAIADRRSGYDSADVDHARELLAEDAMKRKPLSSRRIREVLDDLDGRSSATTRINRRVAAYFYDQTGITSTLAASSRDKQVGNVESMYSDEVGSSPTSVADERGDPVSASDTGTVQEDVMAESLTRPSSSSNSESTVVPETLGRPSSTPSTESASVSETSNAPAPDAGRTAQPQAAKAEIGMTVQHGAKPKHLARELAKAKLPREVERHLRKLIDANEIVDSDGLAAHGNNRTAEWVVENRVGRWYVEALKDRGVKRVAEREGAVSVPSSLLSTVAKSIANSPALKKYPDVKVQSRVLIAAHVRQEMDHETTVHGGAAPIEPAGRARVS